MEFIEKFVIPQSSEHIQLLHYLAMLIFFLFVPFISMVFGGTVLSLFYRNRGAKENNQTYLKFSKEIIEVVTVNKGVGVIIGIVPMLAAVLIYAQLLHLGNILAVSYLSVSLLVVTVSLILIYTYRYSTTFSSVFSSVKNIKVDDTELKNEIDQLGAATKSVSMRSGNYGLLLLFISVWFFISGITIATYPQEWGRTGLFSILFSGSVLFRLFLFLAMAFTFTGGTILFRYFYWEGGKKGLNSEYSELVRNIGVKLTLYSGILVPLFLAVTLFTLPDSAVSGALFGYTTLALLLMFMSYHFLYYMLKNANTRFAGSLYIALLIVIMAVVIKDQLAVDNATQLQAVVLSNKYEEMMAQLTSEGKAPEQVSGEDIYNVRCSSCHAFDHKVVGPPYKETLPKYEGKEGELVKFILNPVQNNPGYPIMPNPGLKPNEAQAVAKWLLSVYKTK